MQIRSILKEIGYNKSWGIRPKNNDKVDAYVFDQEDTREIHAV